ncbi:Protein AIM2 [Trametes pubescens]|uniref:Protein AIM2 n=1 Tax=Trametes pubescens TaxID=154538 RepID=A0A1M2W2L5_TRAPU|nr:Protein AIM2 [Trametes pubescens]
MSAPLTGPLGPCCTRSGTVPHSGAARGTTEQIAGLTTYVARPAAPHAGGLRVIMYFADVFGPLYLNGQLAMDYWAEHGYLVLGVDYFEGDSAAHHKGEEGWDVDEWVIPFRTSAARITPPWIAAVKKRYGACRLSASLAKGDFSLSLSEIRGTGHEVLHCWWVDTLLGSGRIEKTARTGYCFGAPFVMDLLATDWVTAGAFAHPAFLDEGHFERIERPLLMSSPEDDFTFPHAARRRAEDILVARKATYFIQIFGGATHGFATRPDPAVRGDRWAKEESARAVVRWFDHHAGV